MIQMKSFLLNILLQVKISKIANSIENLFDIATSGMLIGSLLCVAIYIQTLNLLSSEGN